MYRAAVGNKTGRYTRQTYSRFYCYIHVLGHQRRLLDYNSIDTNTTLGVAYTFYPCASEPSAFLISQYSF